MKEWRFFAFGHWGFGVIGRSLGDENTANAHQIEGKCGLVRVQERTRLKSRRPTDGAVRNLKAHFNV